MLRPALVPMFSVGGSRPAKVWRRSLLPGVTITAVSELVLVMMLVARVTGKILSPYTYRLG